MRIEPIDFSDFERVAPEPQDDYVINGTEGDDPDLHGPRPAARSLTINGLGGNDVITADFTNDFLSGGDGNDTIYALGGGDLVHGDAGDDYIDTGVDTDSLRGVDQAFGDGGNDFIVSYGLDGTVVSGGAGNDTLVDAATSAGGTVTLDGGDGDDNIVLGSGTLGNYPAHVITSGAGADRITLFGSLPAGTTPHITITDFVPGTDQIAGDPFHWLQIYNGSALNFYGGTQPFATGFLRLVQSGSNVVLQIDPDGALSGKSYFDFITFTGKSLADFTGTSLFGAKVDGSDYTSLNQVGTQYADRMVGGLGNDTLDGGAGDDVIYASGGDDIVNGGLGRDTIDTRDGSSIIHGGDDADAISGAGVHDQLFGDGGDDQIFYAPIQYPGQVTDTALLDGGDGNDYLNFGSSKGLGTLNGGAGADTIVVNGFGASVVDGGSGNDKILIAGDTSTVTLGAGADALKIDRTPGGIQNPHESFTITDYTSGTDQLIIDWTHYLAGWSTATNPFSTGYLNLIQDGADVVLLMDDNGGANSFKPFVRFQNTTLDKLNAADFGGFAPSGGTVVGLTLHGTADPDQISGGFGNDLIYGEGGNDALSGGYGNDVLVGGAGADKLDGGAGSDTASYADQTADLVILLDTNAASGGNATGDTFTSIENVIGGSGNDVLRGDNNANALDGGAGTDKLYGGGGADTYYVDQQTDLIFENAGPDIDSVVSTANFYLYANIENLTLAAGAGNIFGVGNDLANVLTGNEGANTLLAGAGADTVHGGAGVDIIYGEDGNDTLFGDADNDFLAGGAGDDVLDGGTGGDSVYGEAGNDTLYGGTTFEFDRLVGGDGNDVLHGDSGQGDYDYLYGNAGDDSFYVDTGDDLTFEQAGEGTDTVYANIAGANNGVYLYANIENLVLLGTTTFGVGNELANTMTGNASANYLLGGAGNDILNGKQGNDVLFGQDGADTFIFEHGTGGDVVGDFVPGTDKIDLSAIGYTWAQVQNSMHENGGNTAIDLGNGDLVVLNGVTAAQLHQSDFILGGSGSSAAAPPTETLSSVVHGAAIDDHAAIRADLAWMHGHWDAGPAVMHLL